MTLNQLIAVIKKQLSFFNRNKVDVTNDTTLEEVLDHDFNNSQKLFQANVRWSIKNATGKDKKFPSGWMKLSVSDLAGKLVILAIMVMLSFGSQAQVKLNVGGVKTDLKQTAINLAFSYVHNLDSIYGGQDLMVYGKRSYLIITPDVEFRTGTADAFSSIIAKATGLFAKFRTTTVEGIETPDADKTIHVFPVSVGIETSNRFDFLNTLLEVGYQPYYQSETSNAPEWTRHTQFGVYLQGGYKFKLDSATNKPTGGQVDESLEKADDAILRAKGSLVIDTKAIIKLSGINIGLVGDGSAWYDFLNGKIYYKAAGVARVYLSPQTYFDFEYSKGSGAPNFNTGDQWGVGLTIAF